MSKRREFTGQEMDQIARNFAEKVEISIQEAYKILAKVPPAVLEFLKMLHDLDTEIDVEQPDSKRGD